ncbi:hypothetical protein SBF1_2420010 [Candidatus Desulfosporosinus infrequens]|uniref:Uncharacterized protein n=1 Tax=Candidatus Desulfosporosinus infrequens TaxID=2043169 RepID=A0A2U3KNG9_9FIRM|nr:hypothetical protein SBF1_2420010 [Candidatus Desulfosporosinus infrequens]
MVFHYVLTWLILLVLEEIRCGCRKFNGSEGEYCEENSFLWE